MSLSIRDRSSTPKVANSTKLDEDFLGLPNFCMNFDLLYYHRQDHQKYLAVAKGCSFLQTAASCLLLCLIKVIGIEIRAGNKDIRAFMNYQKDSKGLAGLFPKWRNLTECLRK